MRSLVICLNGLPAVGAIGAEDLLALDRLGLFMRLTQRIMTLGPFAFQSFLYYAEAAGDRVFEFT